MQHVICRALVYADAIHIFPLVVCCMFAIMLTRTQRLGSDILISDTSINTESMVVAARAWNRQRQRNFVPRHLKADIHGRITRLSELYSPYSLSLLYLLVFALGYNFLFLLSKMADALCGPSNALQSFQKHASVDRTLQQDRLTSRQSPTEVSTSSITRILHF